MPANVPDTPGRIATLRGYAGGWGDFPHASRSPSSFMIEGRVLSIPASRRLPTEATSDFPALRMQSPEKTSGVPTLRRQPSEETSGLPAFQRQASGYRCQEVQALLRLLIEAACLVSCG